MSLDDATRQRISSLIEADPVTLFMKGTREAPQCGFSATLVRILDTLLPDYQTVDVLADPEIREGIKVYSSWPTIPQLYVKGEFVGGSDILLEMFENGELQKMLGVDDGSDDPDLAPPKLTVSDTAKAQFEAASKDVGDDVLRFEASAAFDYDLLFRDDSAGSEGGSGGLRLRFEPAIDVPLVQSRWRTHAFGDRLELDGPAMPPVTLSLGLSIGVLVGL